MKPSNHEIIRLGKLVSKPGEFPLKYKYQTKFMRRPDIFEISREDYYRSISVDMAPSKRTKCGMSKRYVY